MEKLGSVKVRWSKRLVKLIAKGEQCSEIKWLDNGTTQILSNEQINFGKEASGKRNA